jgi:glutaredoxin
MKYVLFGKPTCPFCVKAGNLLEERNLTYHMVNFEEDQAETLKVVKTAWGWETVPMVFYVNDSGDIKFLGGFDDLERHLDV